MSSSWLPLLTIVFIACSAADIYHPHLPKITRNGAKLGSEEQESKYWQEKARQTVKEKAQTILNKNEAKGVIMFLGDGMSVPTLAATRSFLQDETKYLEFEKFPFTGLSRTYCVDTKVPDSACSATAYLCGVKGNYATIGVNGHVARGDCQAMRNVSTHVQSIAKLFQDKGYATGIVTTTRVTHATPAGAYANVADRDWESDLDVKNHNEDPALCEDIAHQLIKQKPGSGFNVIMGGGRSKFLTAAQGGDRQDEDLINAWKVSKEEINEDYAYLSNRTELLSFIMAQDVLPHYVLGLFAKDHISDHLRNQTEEPLLLEMTEAAISVLQATNKKFFLLVEGGKIDLAHHGNLAHIALDETDQFSQAVGVAVEKTNPSDTLIVVTADHAHTMSFNGYPKRESNILDAQAAGQGSDGKPYLALSYANGPGFKVVDNGRPDYREDDTYKFDYVFPATAPLGSETHGGDDVAIFASGPWAHLFVGSIEENVIHHAMAYAACVGEGPTVCDEQY